MTTDDTPQVIWPAALSVDSPRLNIDKQMNGNHDSRARLNSWKDIASYLEKDVRTVIRWEKERGLPVHRWPGGSRPGVFAYKDEIDQWSNRILNPEASPPLNGTGETTVETLPQLDRPSVAPAGASITGTRKRAFAVLALLVLLAAMAVGARVFYPRGAAGKLQVTGIRQLSNDGLWKDNILPAGSNLYFSERRDGRMVLATMPAVGGTIRVLDSPAVRSEPVDVTADGSRLLVLGSEGHQEERELWIVPVSGEMPKRAGSLLCHSAVWINDGRQILCAVGYDIDLADGSGRILRRILALPAIPWSLRLSLDGRHLRFMLHDMATGAWTPSHVVLSGGQLESSVQAPIRIPQGTLIGPFEWSKSDASGNFFMSIQDNSKQYSIWRINERDGSAPVRISAQIGKPLSLGYELVGKQMFALNLGAQRTELFRFDMKKQAFVPFLPELSATFVDFSKDGNWITYARSDDLSLWTARVQGGEPRRLDFESTEVELPRWSPDGTQIAYMALRPGKTWRIFIVPREGGPAREAAQGNENQGAPTWSPDGKFLVYGGVDCEVTRNCAIHLIELSTGKVTTAPGSEGLGTARWSPDGSRIAALDRAKHQVVVFDLHTKQWKKIAAEVKGNDLNWSRDSRSLYVNRSGGDNPEIIRIPVSGKWETTAVSLDSLNKITGATGTWFGLAPDDSVVVSRWLSVSEIYAIDFRQ